MTFNAETLQRRLVELKGGEHAGRYVVAFSGGLDSSVLLHALVELRGRIAVPVIAVHVNHGLQPDAAAWEAHSRRVAEGMGVEYLGLEVSVVARGGGLEAAAREARYAALRSVMREGDVVLTAHHEEDQAETLLLNLMRGSGLAGLAGIGARQAFGPGVLVRPLLGVSREAIERYAEDAGIEWVDDPANRDLRFDRNFLRRDILPRLRTRWPAVSGRLRRSAELAAEAARLQDDLAALDADPLAPGPDAVDRLDIPKLCRLSRARQRNVVRYAIRQSGLPPAPSPQLAKVLDELLPARPDAQPLVTWRGGEARRYRQTLYLLPAMEELPPAGSLGTLVPGAAVDLGRSGSCRLGRLSLDAGAAVGIDPSLAQSGLEIRFRRGGERLRPAGRRMTRSLKKLLQERGVVPWMRSWLPLLFAHDRLVAVADLWIAEEFAREGGYAVRWQGNPPVF